MKQVQILILNLLAAVCLALAVLLAVQNLSVHVPVQLLTWNFEGVTLGGLLALSALLGGFCLLLRSLVTLQASRGEARKAQRELERTEVSAEEASQKVRALESKVETLETALKEALKAHS